MSKCNNVIEFFNNVIRFFQNNFFILVYLFFMNAVILIAFIVSDYFKATYIVDPEIFRSILSIIAFGSLGLLAIYPIILFQMLNNQNFTKIYDIRPLFISFYISILSNMFLFCASLYLIATVNIISNNSLIASTIIITGWFISTVFLNLITKVDFIRKSLGV